MQVLVKNSTEQEPRTIENPADHGGLITPVRRSPHQSLSLLFERWHPLAFAGTAGLFSALVAGTSIFALDPKADFVLKVVDVSAVFTAYTLTALTVLPVISDRASIVRLRQFGLYKFVYGYIGSALAGSGWLIALGLALKLFFDHAGEFPRSSRILSSVWWASTIFLPFALLRASKILLKLVRG